MSSQELFGDPNTYSQGIWKTRVCIKPIIDQRCCVFAKLIDVRFPPVFFLGVSRIEQKPVAGSKVFFIEKDSFMEDARVTRWLGACLGLQFFEVYE